MLDVFISYSRQNLTFVNQLAEALTQANKALWFDQVKEPLQGIPLGSKWWDEITHGIESADNFLFILTPESIASPYCHAEVAHALKHEKRIVIILNCGETSQAQTLQAIDSTIDHIPPDMELPPTVSADITHVRSLARRNWLAISQIQYVAFESGYAWEMLVKQLIEAIDLDIQWLRMWGQFRQAVQIWQESNFDDDFLWAEKRLKPIRDMITKRAQPLNEHEQSFLLSEQERLLRELENIDTTHQRRAAIGERLAHIGDTRRGVGLRPDGLPDIEWCYVEGGEIIIVESEHSHSPKHHFTVAPFYIAKYLITHAQFQTFVDDPDDFENDEWWQGLHQDGFKHKIHTSRMAFANSPRDTVSWYQAMAYCRWLSAKMPADAFPDGIRSEIRLPMEWEWQLAATGGNPVYAYPWGTEWDGRLANTDEAGLGRSNAVGMYPLGQARCGALDMSGNLWEWCWNEHDIFQNLNIQTNNDRVMRGGSWLNRSYNVCAVSRVRSVSRVMNYYIGFRVCLLR